MEFLKVYSGYVRNFNRAMEVIEHVRKRKEVTQFFEECKNHPDCAKLDLTSFLIMPIQRIPRYSLLLNELLRHTWDTHPDYDKLTEATERMAEIAAYINDKKREAESMSKLINISATLTGKHNLVLAQPQRRFVREGTFINTSNEHELVVYLFTDMILVTKPKKHLGKIQHRYKEAHNLTVIDLIDAGEMFLDIVKISSNNNNKSLLKIQAKDEKEKHDWLSDFSLMKSELVEIDELHDKLRDRSKPRLTAEQRLTMAHIDTSHSDKMNKLQEEQEDLEKKIQDIENTINTSKKLSKKNKKLYEQQLYELREKLDIVAAKIIRLNAQPNSTTQGILKRRSKPGSIGGGGGGDPRKINRNSNQIESSSIICNEKKILSSSSSSSSSISNPSSPIIEDGKQNNNSNTPPSPSTENILVTEEGKGEEGEGEGEGNHQQKEKKELSKQEKKELKKKEKEEKKRAKKAARTSKLDFGRYSAIISRGGGSSSEKKEKRVMKKDTERLLELAKENERKEKERIAKESAQVIDSENTQNNENENNNNNNKNENENNNNINNSDDNDNNDDDDDKDDPEFTYISYEILKKKPRPANIDPTKLETYLCKAEFKQVLGMSRKEFYAMPVWKQRRTKDDKYIL